MNSSPGRRPHLIERAMEALGTTQSFDVRSPVAAPASIPPASIPPASIPPASIPPAGEASADAVVPAAPAAVACPVVAGPIVVGPGTMGAAAKPQASVPVAPPISLDLLRGAGFSANAVGAVRNHVTEEFSVVQYQLLQTIRTIEPAENRLPRMVLITSAKPGEGKTFCSINIAARLASGGSDQILLVDADGKKQGSLTDLLGQSAVPGLRAMATDLMCRPEMMVRPTAIKSLSFISYGPPPSEGLDRPSGVMLAAAIGRLAAAMPGRILIVDAPPCLSASEPAALASIAGQVLMVVGAEDTQRSDVEGALDMVDACPQLQLLLNRTRLTARSSFGAYGYYGG